MTFFACYDEPTDQWIDFMHLTNPRNDRYQSPAGSSTGAAASLAGYPWLDQSIGADIIGSVRAPAALNGLFSLRASMDAASLQGVDITSIRYDAVGLLGRSVDSIQQLITTTFKVEDNLPYPKRILYPTDIEWYENEDQQSLIDRFVSVLEKFTGTRRVKFSFENKWTENPPNQAEGKPIWDYLDQCAFEPMCYDYFRMFENFRSEYKKRFGKDPYVGPMVKYRWGVSERFLLEKYQEGYARQVIFRDWCYQHLLSPNPGAQSDAIVILPFGPEAPKYRDEPNSCSSFQSLSYESQISDQTARRAPFSPTTWEFIEGFLSPMLQAP